MQWSWADKQSLLARSPALLFTFHGTYRRQQTPQVHKGQAENHHHCNDDALQSTQFPRNSTGGGLGLKS